ncbi:Outer membrane lipoprotein carrier protein LolA [hydrothermal vent metagenome]|uniref:Outer membrane lipoprotein carrier protein LolA n=1 Tax=hydrothermal vent metagenome TaxID=652676 RepID=A0A3B1DTZ2_9ZZZZ
MKALTIILLTFCELFSEITTYQAKFIQKIKNPSGTTILYDGTVYIKQPNKMLWRYKTPIKKDVYMDDLNITINEPELEQVIYTTLTSEINLITFLNNPDLIDDKYSLKFENNRLLSIIYNDDMENNITILFEDIELNKKIPDQLFQFIAPLDYDIIEQ